MVECYDFRAYFLLFQYEFIILYVVIDDEVVDMQYRPLCSPKLKNSFLTRDHDRLTILASCLHLLSFLAPTPLKSGK